MKTLTKILLAATALVACATTAHADPVSGAIFSFLYTVGLPGAFANFVANNLIAIALIGVSVATSLGQKSGAATTSDAKATVQNSPEVPAREGIGRISIGSIFAFKNTDGSTRWRAAAHLLGPIDGIEEYYLGETEIVVDPDGLVQSPPWSKVGGSWARWSTQIGNGSETAWGDLVSNFTDAWTTNHKGVGIFQSLLTFYNPGLDSDKYLSLYQGNFDDARLVLRASPIYDPRDGTQDAETPSTWKWNDNGPLACVHMRRRQDDFFDADKWNWTLIAAEADKADASTATKTGTEKRSRFWGMWEYNGSYGDTLADAHNSTGTEMRRDENGLFYVAMVDDNPSAEIEFGASENCVIDATEQLGPAAAERPNVCRVKYYSPEMDYELTEIDMTGIAWARVDAEVNKYGPKETTIELPFCPSAAQACRIARRMFIRKRANTLNMTLNAVGLAAWNKRYASIVLPEEDDATLFRLNAPVVNDADMTISIGGTVYETLSAFNPSADEADAPEERPETGYQSDIVTPGSPTNIIQVQYPDASYEMRIQYPAAGYDGADCNYRVYSATTPSTWASTVERGGTGGTIATVAGNFSGQDIEARLRAVSGDSVSNFSSSFHEVVSVDNTPPAVPLVDTSATPDITITAPNNISVVAVEVSSSVAGPGGNFVEQLFPGESFTFSASTADYDVFALTTDGTTGAVAEFSVA